MISVIIYYSLGSQVDKLISSGDISTDLRGDDVGIVDLLVLIVGHQYHYHNWFSMVLSAFGNMSG